MRATLSLAFAAFVLLAGCSSDDADTTGTTTAPDTTTTGMMDHSAKTHHVPIEGSAFVNSTLTIYVGDKVHWMHQDGNTAHTVTSDDGSGETFDSDPNCGTAGVGVPVSQVCMVEPDTFEHTFSKAGTFGYHCKVHAGMTGTVTVLEHPQ